MGILFAGGEAESFNVIGATALYSSVTAGHYDSDFSRGALGITGTTTCDVDLASGVTDLWVHAGVSYNQTSISLAEIIKLIDTATGRVVLSVFKQNSTNLFSIRYWDGSAYQEVIGSSAIIQDTFYTVDLHCKIADSVGDFSLYLDGSLVASFAGDTLNNDYTQIDRVRFGAARTDTTSTGNGTLLSQVIVSEDDTRGLFVKTLHVTGDGTNTDWAGDSTDVDEALTYDDVDVISSGSADDVSTFALVDAVVTDYDVVAVSVVARGLRGASGPQNMQAVVRTGGSDFFSGNFNGVDVTYKPLWNLWPTNPDTAAAWTLSELDSLEAGVKSIA